MKIRFLLFVAIAAALGVAGFLGVRWYTTPALPEIPTDGLAKVLADAIDEALSDVRADPRSGYAWGKLAMVLAANSLDEKTALRCFENAERFDPKNPAWPYLHGLQIMPTDPQQGIPLLRQAFALAKKQDERTAILFRLANVLIENGQLDEAAQHLEALRQIEPDPRRVHYTQAMLAMARGDGATARGHLLELTDHPSCRRRSLSLLASLADTPPKLAAGYKEQAARLPADEAWPDSFATELTQHKVDIRTRSARYLELTSQGQHQEAMMYLRRVVAESPDDELCFMLGFALLKSNEPEEAAQRFRESLRYNAKNVKTHLFLGAALYAQGENRLREPQAKEQALELFRQSIAAFDQAIAYQADLGTAHLFRGRALQHLGREDEAIAALRNALLLQPDSADTHLYLGEALAESGNLREGLEHLDNAVQIAQPKDARPAEALKKWRAKQKTAKPG